MKLGTYITLKDKLNEEYLEKFNRIESYGELHNVPQEVMSERMMDLMDIMLTAQEKGKVAESVVGSNTDTFCKNFFSGITAGAFLKGAARKIRTLCTVVLVIELIILFASVGDDGFDFFRYKSDMSGYIIGLAAMWCGVLIADIAGETLLKCGKYSRKAYLTISIAATVLSLACSVILMINVGDISIPGCYPILVSGAYLAIYYAVTMYLRYHKTGTLKKQSNEYETTFWGAVGSEIKTADYSKDKSIVKTFAKRYINTNNKRVKKGKDKLATEEFFIHQNKMNRLSTYIAFPAVICVLAVFAALESGPMFESAYDFGIFALIILPIYAGIFFFIRKLEKVVITEQKSILSACKACNVELDAYYDILMAETSLSENDDSDVYEKQDF